MSSTFEKFQRNLVRFRDALQLKNEQLADRCGIPLGTMQKFLNGQRKIQGDDIEKIAGALGLNPGDFYLEDPPMPKPEELPPIWLKVGPEVAPDIIEKARKYERELRREHMARVHAEKKKQKPR